MKKKGEEAEISIGSFASSPWVINCAGPEEVVGVSFLVDFSAQLRAPTCREVLSCCDVGDVFVKGLCPGYFSSALKSHQQP